jgi:hypothetical protein
MPQMGGLELIRQVSERAAVAGDRGVGCRCHERRGRGVAPGRRRLPDQAA